MTRAFIHEGASGVHKDYLPSFFRGEFLSDAHARAETDVADLPGRLEPADHFKLYEAGFFAQGPVLQVSQLGAKSGLLLALGLRDAGLNFPLFLVEADRSCLKVMKARLDPLGVKVRLLRGDSIKALDDVDETFDTVFVDGNHSYDGVRRDLTALLPRLAPSAIVLVHDYFHRRNNDPSDTSYGVRQAVDELVSRGDLKFRGGYGGLALFERERPDRPSVARSFDTSGNGSAAAPRRLLSVGMIEPHLKCYGGIRRMVEFANRLIARGHRVTFYLSDGAKRECDWMPCHAEVKWVRQGLRDDLDVILFNHEPQWHLLSGFEQAKLRVFYALHYSRLYQKAGSWESIRANTDVVFANSTWTADMIEADVGRRPSVVLGGVSHELFHPVDSEKRYPILCVGDERHWKGTRTIEEAARLLNLPLERYAHKRLPQTELAMEYGRAEVFAVASLFEGFGWPGLEALACGVPLVTTDNGGCREYAYHEKTALVVPPDDPAALADAIGRLRQDVSLADRMVENGLELVRTKFEWSSSVHELEDRLTEGVEVMVEQPSPRKFPRLLHPRPNSGEPLLSLVVLAWDELQHTQACVESIRQHTDVPYELIIVDNGSAWEAANYARQAADEAVINPRNLGFAHGMNQGLAKARGQFVAFCNNDIVFPRGWASRLISHLQDGDVGIVVPAVTAAQNPLTVRAEPGESVSHVKPFEAPPPAIVYVMSTAIVRALEGWGEEYKTASAEDVDLAFKVWVNGLQIVFDSRVLIEHVSKGTAREKLVDWEALWSHNRELFLSKWQQLDSDIPRLDTCPADEFAYRRLVAASVVGWMRQYFSTRDKLRGRPGKEARKGARPVESVPATRGQCADGVVFQLGKRVWPHINHYLPGEVRSFLVNRYAGR